MNSQRCWANRAIIIKAATAPKSVPDMRNTALLKDCPMVARLQKATANPAQKGLSQPISRAIA